MRYLGYRGQEVSGDILNMIENTAAETEKTAAPRFCYTKDVLVRRDGRLFLSGGRELEGESIKKHLRGCAEVILFAATLGIETDRLIRLYEIRDMTRAVVMDACASALIETYCDSVCAQLEREAMEKGLYLTQRFSPGYGDMPMSLQLELVRITDAQRKIGLTLNDSLLMIPRKSVTAVMGLSEEKQRCAGYGCEMCSMNKTCTSRRTK